MNVLITGGAGYIGSHCLLAVLRAGHSAVVLDNLSNSTDKALERVSELAKVRVPFVKADLRSEAELTKIFDEHQIEGVMHFAGLKAVGESVLEPLLYYSNNVCGTANLLSAMQSAGVRDIVFSSSCTVYGTPRELPVREDHSVAPQSPYGRTKAMIEDMLADLAAMPESSWRVVLLRYFNPVGADPSGMIGEDPLGMPNNLMPVVMQVAAGRREELEIFGDDYPTKDGTCIRDYIHVSDLAEGHVAALEYLKSVDRIATINLGSGTGYSVLEVLEMADRVVGRRIPRRMAGRRPGDVAEVYADPTKARETLGWSTTRTLQDMCVDHWRWQQANPSGYR